MSGFAVSDRVVGEVIAYRFADNPDGWLELDGATYNVDDFQVLGALYGKRPGQQFTVDDWRDLPIWGAGVVGTVGSIVGSDTEDFRLGRTDGSLQVDLSGINGSGVDPSRLAAVIDKRPRRGLVRWLIYAG